MLTPRSSQAAKPAEGQGTNKGKQGPEHAACNPSPCAERVLQQGRRTAKYRRATTLRGSDSLGCSKRTLSPICKERRSAHSAHRSHCRHILVSGGRGRISAQLAGPWRQGGAKRSVAQSLKTHLPLLPTAPESSRTGELRSHCQVLLLPLLLTPLEVAPSTPITTPLLPWSSPSSR